MFQPKQNKNHSPIRQRKRQFSQIRQDNSRRHGLSTSALRYSPKTNKSSYNDQKHRQTRMTGMSGSPVKTLCVGCFNKQLCEAKLKKKQEQAAKQNEKTNLSLINGDDYEYTNAKSRALRQFQQVNRYNKQKINNNRHMKQLQKEQKQKSTVQFFNQLQQDKKAQRNRALVQHQRLQQLRKDLIEQMQKKKSKQERQKKQKNGCPQAIFCDPNKQKMQQQIQNKYKNDLKNQIAENKRKREQQHFQIIKKQIQQQQIANQQMQEKQQQKRQLLKQRQKQKQEEASKIREEIQTKKLIKYKQEKQKQDEVQKDLKSFLEQKQKLERLRRTKIDNYLTDLKKQMAVNQEKKVKQYAWLREPSNNLLVDKKQREQRSCDSCQKHYPSSYLTKVNQPIRL